MGTSAPPPPTPPASDWFSGRTRAEPGPAAKQVTQEAAHSHLLGSLLGQRGAETGPFTSTAAARVSVHGEGSGETLRLHQRGNAPSEACTGKLWEVARAPTPRRGRTATDVDAGLENGRAETHRAVHLFSIILFQSANSCASYYPSSCDYSPRSARGKKKRKSRHRVWVM